MGGRASGLEGYQGRVIFAAATALLLGVGVGHTCGSQVSVCPPLWPPFLLQLGGDLVPNPLNMAYNQYFLPQWSLQAVGVTQPSWGLWRGAFSWPHHCFPSLHRWSGLETGNERSKLCPESCQNLQVLIDAVPVAVGVRTCLC